MEPVKCHFPMFTLQFTKQPPICGKKCGSGLTTVQTNNELLCPANCRHFFSPICKTKTTAAVVSLCRLRLWAETEVEVWEPPTCMQVPVCSRHRLQDRAQRLAGMCDTLVMGSIFSGQPILTWREENHKQSAFLCIRNRRILNKWYDGQIHSE